ncbi:MAG: SMC-Scp complex subunit ScpB [Cellvibrionaceae bacterium]
MSIDQKLLKRIIEGALMASGTVMSVQKILELFEPREGEDPELEFEKIEKPSKDEIIAILQDIEADDKGHGYELKEVGSGWRYQVVEEVAPWISRMWEEKPQKYSRASLETLALIAYRQPITRGDIESIRGVAVSSNIIKTLAEREWVKVVGHRDVPGRPALYATTKQFLDYFNIKSLEELPSLKEIQDLEKIGDELDLQVEGEIAENAEGSVSANDENISDVDVVDEVAEVNVIDEIDGITEVNADDEGDSDNTSLKMTEAEEIDELEKALSGDADEANV